MVATINVISGGARAVSNYFLALENDFVSDYYVAENGGQWHGEAAAILGLTGTVQQSDFEHILVGESPAGIPLVEKKKRPKRQRGKETKPPPDPEEEAPKSDSDGAQPSEDNHSESTSPPKGRVGGYDMTFSAPKSVSLAWAIADEKTRPLLEEALIAAAKAAVDDLERSVPWARRGSGGRELVDAKLVTSLFQHTLSRDNDPQLHVHAVISNVCLGADGRWAAVNSRLLHRWTPAFGRVFRCHLARELTKRLGVELYRPTERNGKQSSWFEIKGIPRRLIDQFSSRRRSIEAALSPEKMKDAKARQKANLATRKKKTHDLDISQMRQRWRNEATRQGVNFEKLAAARPAQSNSLNSEEYQRAFSEAVSVLGQKQSHFHEADLVSAVCEKLQHRSVDPGEILRKVRKDMASSPEVVMVNDRLGNSRLTSRSNWELEKKLLTDVEGLRKEKGATIKHREADRIVQKKSNLDAEQKAAAKRLLTQKSAIRILSGVAGSGKSTTLEAVKSGLERAGYKVLGGALAGKAAQELADKTGVNARTIASYLHHLDKSKKRQIADRVRHDVRMLVRTFAGKSTWRHQRVKLPRKSVIMIDEVGMLDSRTLSRLLHHARRAKATVILAGDSKQLPPILAGGPMDHLSQKIGESQLNTNRRQKDPEDRKAVDLLREGKVKEALKNYEKRGRLKIAEDQSATEDRLVGRWKRFEGHRKPQENLILTQNRDQARRINQACQQVRLRSAKLLPGLSVKHGDYRYYIGDHVAFRQPMRKFGIENGHTASVVGVDPLTRKLTVRLHHQPSSHSSFAEQSRLVKIPLLGLSKDAMSLGYASTTHRAQGMTCKRAFVLLTGNMMSTELVYTQLTRARERTELFVSKDQVEGELEQLVSEIEKSSAKNLAHDIADKKTLERRGNQVKREPAKQELQQEHELRPGE